MTAYGRTDLRVGVTRRPRLAAVGAILLGAVLGPIAVISPLYAVALVFAVVVFGLVVIHPQYAAYISLALAPLLIGVERGSALPVLRPHEALFALVGLALVARGIAGLLAGRSLVLRVSRVDLALLAITVLSSILPLWWEIARAIRPSRDDLLHSLVLWKYVAVYLIVRSCIRTQRQIRNCLWVVLGVNSLVATIAILQALRIFGMDRLMATLYPPLGSPRLALNGRGTSTLGHSIAVGDVMAISLAIAVAMVIWRRRSSDPVWVLIVVFALGGVASGQMSGVIALAVAVVVVGYVTKRLARVYLVGVPMLAAAGVLMMPVLNSRLVEASAASGMPPSWSGRIENLQTYIWPRVFSDFNYLLGVRPSPRIPAWEAWREWIFIESGYTWFLWVGGIPLLVAFFYFAWAVIRTTVEVSREGGQASAIAAVAACAAMWMFVVLTLFDAHLTLRGAADLFFPLLALAMVAVPARSVIFTRELRPFERTGGETRVVDSPQQAR